jgi:hypothetical protein
MTRLSCHRFRSNEVRLWLSVMAYNLGNLWQRLALPSRMDHWSLVRLQPRLVKTGGRLVKHARCYWLLLAESHLMRRLSQNPTGRLYSDELGGRLSFGRKLKMEIPVKAGTTERKGGFVMEPMEPTPLLYANCLLRKWREHLLRPVWIRMYPGLFCPEDLQYRNQEVDGFAFGEWFTSIHLHFQNCTVIRRGYFRENDRLFPASGATSVLRIDPQCWKRTRGVNKASTPLRRHQEDASDGRANEGRVDGPDRA